MAAGQAQRIFDSDPQKRKVAICDSVGQIRWHELWEGNPVIATPREVSSGHPVQFVSNGIGCRPYLKSLSYSGGAVYADWKASEHVGRLYLTEDERRLGNYIRQEVGGDFVVIEPGGKETSCRNKFWGFRRYQAVVKACPDVRWVQMVYDGAPAIRGVRPFKAKTFREACGVIAASRAYLGPEGGLHHAAGVLGIPAVVIFGGFISPAVTGYPIHINLADEGPGSPCGRWKRCDHCKRAMAAIKPGKVIAALHTLLEREQVAA